MLAKVVTTGFRLYTLPARLAYRQTARLFNLPDDPARLLQEARAVSEEVARELQRVLDSVDRDMSARAAHLSPPEREQAAQLALHAAEQHLSMAAINVLRAFWLATAEQRLEDVPATGEIIEQE